MWLKNTNAISLKSFKTEKSQKQNDKLQNQYLLKHWRLTAHFLLTKQI